jgi:hypothetical protein
MRFNRHFLVALMIKFVSPDNPLHRLSAAMKEAICLAQENVFDHVFPNTATFLATVFDQLRIKLSPETFLADVPATEFSEKSFGALTRYFAEFLSHSEYPEQAILRTSVSLSSRAMLLRAFSDPDAAVTFVREKIVSVVNSFPKNADDIMVGRNKGDVLDPFILTATQYLLYQGEFDGAVSATVSHKALMIIEGLMGHLHEDVLGLMRSNVRVPEPRGVDQETFNYKNNPFPGADLIQPPIKAGDRIKIHQIKSKTGSAKGGDGKRLGDQLRFLSEQYDADIFYDALIGNTLVGHRSKTGVEKAAPSVRVLVGQAAFSQLTGSRHGASLLLRLYQESFLSAAQVTGYSMSEVTEKIVEHFKAQSASAGEDYLDTILEKSTGGNQNIQDSFYFNRRRR